MPHIDTDLLLTCHDRWIRKASHSPLSLGPMTRHGSFFDEPKPHGFWLVKNRFDRRQWARTGGASLATPRTNGGKRSHLFWDVPVLLEDTVFAPKPVVLPRKRAMLGAIPHPCRGARSPTCSASEARHPDHPQLVVVSARWSARFAPRLCRILPFFLCPWFVCFVPHYAIKGEAPNRDRSTFQGTGASISTSGSRLASRLA